MNTIKTIDIVGILLALGVMLVSCDGRVRRTEAERLYIAAIDAYTEQQYADSLELVRRAIKLDRNFYQASFLEGRNLFFLDKLDEAEKIFSRLVSRYPAYTEARIWYIRCLILTNDFKTAKELLDKELSFNQTDWRIYSLYSLLAQQTNNFEERIAMNRRAENTLIGSARVYLDMAIIWHTLGLRDRAQTYIEKAQHIIGTNLSFHELEVVINQFLQE
jgi:tetratricopeptide (TPR) repeat protein